jgi:hypothetical protein
MRKSALLSALLLGAALFTGSTASAQPRAHNPGRGWHGHPVAHNRFVFHHDFRHFTPVEHRAWVGGQWRHSWWHGHNGWWWGVGGAWYFYNAPVYPYPAYVSPTYYGDDYDDGGDDQGYGDGGYQGGYGGGGVWYHCSSPDGYYPYIRDCHGGWQQVPATPGGMEGGPGEMQGGPPPGGPGGPGNYGPPQGGPGGQDNYGPPPGGPGGQGDYGPPPGGQYPGDQNGPPPPGH